MDIYPRIKAQQLAVERRQQRKETLKTILTVVVTLPVLWLITVLFLCI
jgi:hypothetical protein